jgi:hypothetical protein
LVHNSIPVQDFEINTNREAEINGIRIKIQDHDIKIYNFYCPKGPMPNNYP